MKQQRIEVLLELISCNQPLFYWRYDEQGNLLYSDCPAEKMLDVVLRRTGGLRCIYEMGHNAPLLIGADSSLLWIADRENLEGKGLFQIHVLGPFFSHEHGVAGIEEMTRQVVAQASPQWANAFLEVARALPTLSLPFYSQYAVMLHYLLSGEKIPTSSLDYQIEMQPVPADFSNLKKHTPPKDRLQTYRAERALLNAVREGDMDCADTMEIASSVAKVREYTDNQLRNVQIACTTFATLCTRAAIEGGLSTTKSYCLGDAYIKSFFFAKTASEVSAIKNQMYKDFVTRVHNCRNNPQYSKMVQGSRDYIELHLAEPISIETLATRLGYSKYYLSTRFKKEIGCSVNDYIKFVRIERAKRLLSTTEKNISEIAENTGFASRNFFASTFKQCVGKTPAQYRKEMLNT